MSVCAVCLRASTGERWRSCRFAIACPLMFSVRFDVVAFLASVWGAVRVCLAGHGTELHHRKI